ACRAFVAPATQLALLENTRLPPVIWFHWYCVEYRPTLAAPTDCRYATAPWSAATLSPTSLRQLFIVSTSSHHALAVGVRVAPAGASSLGPLPAPRHGFGLNTIPPFTPTIPKAGFEGKGPPHCGYEMS